VQRRPAAAILVGNNRQAEMIDRHAIHTLLFSLMGGALRAEGILLNKELRVGATAIVRDFAAHFLGALESAFFDLIRQE
jgi:hypothetical protein